MVERRLFRYRQKMQHVQTFVDGVFRGMRVSGWHGGWQSVILTRLYKRLVFQLYVWFKTF